jgi:hypothetical protein
VLWRLGTNAILRGHERWPSSSLIRDGIRRMKAIGADVVLIASASSQAAMLSIVEPEDPEERFLAENWADFRWCSGD